MRNIGKIALTIVTALFIVAVTIVIALLYIKEDEVKAAPVYEEVPTDSITFLTKTPQEGIWEAMEYYGILHQDIVYAQAIIESGLGKSNLYKRTNNLFGLYDSRHKRYFSFNHWSESVLAYRDMIQYRYRPPDDYYAFLAHIHYASDPRYINKLKQIVETNAEIKQNAGTGDNQQAREGG